MRKIKEKLAILFLQVERDPFWPPFGWLPDDLIAATVRFSDPMKDSHKILCGDGGGGGGL